MRRVGSSADSLHRVRALESAESFAIRQQIPSTKCQASPSLRKTRELPRSKAERRLHPRNTAPLPKLPRFSRDAEAMIFQPVHKKAVTVQLVKSCRNPTVGCTAQTVERRPIDSSRYGAYRTVAKTEIYDHVML
jgi:hypothetical protein